MSGTKTTRAKDATITRLLEQCEQAGWFRFEVSGAPSITIHVEPDGMGRWAVTRYGWEEVKALTAAGWERFCDRPFDQRFIWPIGEALARIPALLDELHRDHAAWQRQRAQAERARQFAQVAEELLEPVRNVVNLLKAGAA